MAERIEAHMDGPHWVFESDPNYGWKPVVVIDGSNSSGTFYQAVQPVKGTSQIVSVTIPSGSAYSTPVEIKDYVFGQVLTPDTWTGNPNLGILSGMSLTGSFYAMRDELGVLLECTGMITGSWSWIPIKSMSSNFLKFRAESGTVPVSMPRNGDQVLWLELKG